MGKAAKHGESKGGPKANRGPAPGWFERVRVTESEANRLGRGNLDLYARHRQRVTQHLCAQPDAGTDPEGRGGRVCLLGAGNAHDVDLDALAARFSQVHLVDIDAAALDRALARVAPAARPRFVAHAPVDLSGVLDALDRRVPASMTEVEALAETAPATLAARLPGPFDLVASCCVMTQIHWALGRIVAEGDLLLPALRQVAILVHLRTLVRLLAPGRTGLVFNDATSDSFVDLPGAAADLIGVLDAAQAAGQVFPPTDPVMLRRLLRRDPVLSGQVAVADVIDHWLWTGAQSRTYLVYALRLARHPA